MKVDKEEMRHLRVMEEIKNATNKEQLPDVTLSNIARYLASNASIDKVKVSQTAFKPVIEALTKYNYFTVPEVKEAFMKVLAKSYPGKTEEEYESIYTQISEQSNIGNYLEEIQERANRIKEFEEAQDLENHKAILKKIDMATELKELPPVGKNVLNSKIRENVKNDFTSRINISEFQDLTEAILSKKSEEEIRAAIFNLCQEKGLDDEDTYAMYEQIAEQIFADKRLGYIVEEIDKKEEKISQIYRQDHEANMEAIKEAKRISQLPPNLTFSTLAGYLSGNTVIYPKSGKISSVELKGLTQLLLSGKTFEDDEVKAELARVAGEAYPEKAEEAKGLLYDKMSNLPKTNYLIEEINYSQKRQEEFIGRNCSNVNVYFIPNPKTPADGGRFYNCYINRVDNLNLQEILPLDLSEIVPPGMDIDSIEWYVQERFDPTFKAAGGIILNKDETIGNVSVFKPSDGTVGITPEEKNKYEQLKELKAEVSEILKDRKTKMNQFVELQKNLLSYMEEQDNRLAKLEEKISQIQGDTEVADDGEER